MMNASFFVRQMSLITLLTAGVSLEMIGGVVDLAFAAQLSASTLTGISLIALGCPIWIGCISIFFFNAVIGILKAVFYVKFRVPSIIFTLAMQVILCNFLAAVTDNTGIVLPGIREAYRGRVYTSIEFIVMIVFMACAFLFLERSYYGKYCRMLGENLNLAQESGVKCFGISAVVHVFASLFFSTAAIFLMLRTGSSNGLLGTTYLYQILTAVFLGGIVPDTGRGRIWGVLCGALIVTLAVSFLTAAGYLYRLENILEGSVILAVLAFSTKKKN